MEIIVIKQIRFTVLAVPALFLSTLFVAPVSWAQSTEPTQTTGVDKLYVLDCGLGHGNDMGHVFENEVDVGVPHDDPVHCYLIHHATKGWFLFDTGISDFVASMPNGWQAGDAAEGVHWTRPKGTVLSQLAAIGVKPSDIHMIGLSHSHPDHMGNIEEFPDAILYVQKDEYEFAFSPGHLLQQPPGQPWVSWRKEHPVKLLIGDTDVFGDGSVMLIATPGHTPGHQSCMVHLPQTGWVILTGDAFHKGANFEWDRVPHLDGMDTISRLETLTSMQRIYYLADHFHAQVWINHDPTDSAKHQYAPFSYQ
jgi:N-acyl homoserine lactone hydrolase